MLLEILTSWFTDKDFIPQLVSFHQWNLQPKHKLPDSLPHHLMQPEQKQKNKNTLAVGQWLSTGGLQDKFGQLNHTIQSMTGFQNCEDNRETIMWSLPLKCKNAFSSEYTSNNYVRQKFYFYSILSGHLAHKVPVQKTSGPQTNIVGDPCWLLIRTVYFFFKV